MTPPSNMLNSMLIQRLGWTLIHSIWEAAAVAILAAIVLFFLRKGRPQARYWVACGAMLLMAAAPAVTFFSMDSVHGPSAQLTAAQDIDVPPAVTKTESAALVGRSSAAGRPAIQAHSSPPPRPSDAAAQMRITSAGPVAAFLHATGGNSTLMNRLSHALPWIVLAWAAGVLLMSLWNLGGWIAVRQLRRVSTQPAGADLEAMLARLAKRLGLRHPVKLLQSALAQTPLVIGAIKPVILLPASVLCELPAAELESIIAHELAHVLRHDYLINLIQAAIETLLFYHPAAWWISRRIRAERENCCDDLALEVTRDRATYARALAAAASIRVPALAPAASGASLLPRLRRILGIPDAKAAGSSPWLAGVVAAGLCLFAMTFAPAPPPAKAAPADADAVVVHGRVLDADGKPFAGARVIAFVNAWRTDHPLSESRSSANGQFEITFHKSQFTNDLGPWQSAGIAAAARGWAPAWTRWDHTDARGDLILKLARDDIPIEGRIVNTEGRGVKGAKVRLVALDSKAVDLSKLNIDGIYGPSAKIPAPRLPGYVISAQPAATSDANGRFRINGLGSNRTAGLDVAGPGIAGASINVVTRREKRASRTFQQYLGTTETTYGATFDYTAIPDRPVMGTVRDAKTGKPLAGVAIHPSIGGYNGRTITDARGQYRINGMSKREGIKLTVVADAREPYLVTETEIPQPAGYAPVILDFNLHRGVWITGKVTDQSTGQPVAGARIVYRPYLTNAYAQHTPEFANTRMPGSLDLCKTGVDGTYRLVGVPGQALIAVDWTEQPYRAGIGVDQVKCRRRTFRGGRLGEYLTFRPPIGPQFIKAIKDVAIPQGAAKATVNLQLDPGITIHVTAADPEGRPLPRLAVLGNIPGAGTVRIAGAAFDAVALSPDEQRRITVWNAARKIGRVVTVSAADVPSRHLTIKLEPWSQVSGRLIGQDGLPVANARIEPKVDYIFPGGTDAQGRFHLPLVPGMECNLRGIKGRDEFQTDAWNVPIQPGRAEDLGDVNIVPWSMTPPMQKPATRPAAAAASEDEVHVHGRVLNPDGRPTAGAKVSVAANWTSDDPAMPRRAISQGTCGPDGRFAISFKKSRLTPFSVQGAASGARNWKRATVVAYAPGYGIAWSQWDKTDAAGEVVLKLAADAPVEGRIVDLEGRPVPGVKVTVVGVQNRPMIDWAPKRQPPADYSALAFPADAAGIAEPALTDSDGRFRIAGMGKDRGLVLEFQSARFVLPLARVVTRDMKPVIQQLGTGAEGRFIYYGRNFELTASPARAVIGMVADAATGKPLAGIHVDTTYAAHPGHAITDVKGQYRLDGLDRHPNTEITASVQGGDAYLPQTLRLSNPVGVAPTRTDFKLARGVWITGKVLDKSTGNSVPVTVQYVPMLSNAHAFPTFRPNIGFSESPCRTETRSDGTFRLIGMAGRGIVGAVCSDKGYRRGVGTDRITERNKAGRMNVYRPFDTPSWFNSVAQVDVPAGAAGATADLELDPGGSVTVTAIAPAGAPAGPVWVQGDKSDRDSNPRRIEQAGVRVSGFGPGEKRVLVFSSPTRKLGRVVVVGPNDVQKGTLKVDLQPMARITGRVLSMDGDPINGATIRIDTCVVALRGRNLIGIVRAHAGTDGRFETLVPPGCNYIVGASRSPFGGRFKWAAENLPVGSGKSKDLGDIRLNGMSAQ